jgi:hypothetical protein
LLLNRRRVIALLTLLLAAAGGAYLAWSRPWSSKGLGPRAGEAAVSAGPFFEEITASSGVEFQHWCGDGGRYFFPEVMGSGIGLLDYDRDGDLDLFAVQGMPPAAAGKPALPRLKPSASSRLFAQEGGGRFQDVTELAGLVDKEPYGMGVAVGDVNNDGWPDLYVSKYGRDRLFVNRQGRFADVTQEAGIDNPDWGTSACFFDYDRDGWLDLLVTNYVDYVPSRRCLAATGHDDYCHPNMFGNVASRLFRNETGEAQNGAGETGKGAASAPIRFRDVSVETGIAAKAGPGLGVVPGDFNGDGWIDVYVANDAKANFLWINREGKRFEDEAIVAGAAYDAAGRPQSSMGVAAGDVDGDGRHDLFMTHLDGEYSTLYLQIADGVFEDRTVSTGLASATIPFTGFGTAFFDLELDGDLDLAIVNGRVRSREESRGAAGDPAAFWRRYAERNQLFLGDGRALVEVKPGRDPFLEEARVYRGLAVGDIDNDGDLDLATSEINGPARLIRNVAPRKGHWLAVRAVEPSLGGRDALGAMVTVVAGRHRWMQPVNPACSYLSASDARVHFGLGAIDAVDQILVRWPDGSCESFAGGKADCLRTLAHGEGNQP